jgi:hypothetical protein
MGGDKQFQCFVEGAAPLTLFSNVRSANSYLAFVRAPARVMTG